MHSPKYAAILLAALLPSVPLFGQKVAASRPAVPDSALLRRPFDAQDNSNFARPPRIFYPETWFHFVNGNVSHAGIKKDLEAIASAGITGVQLFHGKIGNPADWPGTKEHIECLSPKWEELVRYTASEAHRLGLRFSLQTCPGWATSGGPWIRPEQAMRHLAMSRTDVPAGGQIDSVLAVPATADWQDWRDVCVLAFPTPQDDTGRPMEYENIRSAEPEYQEAWEALLRDGKAFILPPTTADKPHRVRICLLHNHNARSLVFNPIDNFNHEFGVQPDIHLRVLGENQHEKPGVVLDTDFPRANWEDSQRSMTFALDQRCDYGDYTVEIVNRHPMRLSQMYFLSAVRGHNWEAEAGWTLRSLLRTGRWPNDIPKYDAQRYVRRRLVQDITECMDASGRLRWKAPQDGLPTGTEGWTILRIGHVNTGQRNGPAPEEATGWEVNKLDTAFVSFQFRSYIGRLLDGPLKGLVDNMLMDSWECHSQTWTRYMEQEFETRRHYALRTWLPALFGFVVDDREQTAEFLNDWRRTINELFVDNFYGHMSRLARERGLTVSYETAAGDIFPACPMEYYKHADVPMTEFWQPFSHWLSNHNYKPIRPTASAARMYGKPRVTAEAFTSFDLTWDEHLSMLRDVANQNMVEGVSHLVFHTYTHNPAADSLAPGTSFGGAIGTPFLRRQTWWPMMPHFTASMARCAYMLERGRPVNSVLWYLGDEIEQKPDQYAAFPEGYSYDYCNTDALLHRIDVKNGKWVTPDGIEYDVLWIPERGRMLPATLERINELIIKGGRLVGDFPTSLATWARDDSEDWRIQDAVLRIWSEYNAGTKVFSHMTLQQALEKMGVKPDVKPTPLRWTHRRAEGADWYMVCPPKEETFEGDVSFHQKGRAELWNPMNGSVVPVAVTPDGDYSRIHLRLQQGECLFVVFRHDGKEEPVLEWAETSRQPLATPWTITFPAGWGIEAPVTTSELAPWKNLPLSDEGRAFSGTAVYETQFTLDRRSKRCRYQLSLGRVEEIAVVEVNGHVCDTLWAAPYTADVTRFVRQGRNRLRIHVTSTWRNRLIYDASRPEAERRTWVINGPRGDAPLVDSGLMGPVAITEETSNPPRQR